LKFTALLEPAEEGGFVIKCIELPIATEGETKGEAQANLKEAIEGYSETRSELKGKTMKKRELVEITVLAQPVVKRYESRYSLPTP
jgi:predicted RNase H-like HicB family nuclease